MQAGIAFSYIYLQDFLGTYSLIIVSKALNYEFGDLWFKILNV